jgi:rhamnosyltransferase
MIFAIVVTFNPAAIPHALCGALSARCRVIVVDNSTIAERIHALRAWSAEHDIALLPIGTNLGIAAAQNAGVAFARSMGATGVLFFDQDSIVELPTVSLLVEAVSASPSTVFCLLPTAEAVTRLERVPVRELMSSGSGCGLAVFEVVGGFETELFIDCVDFEWGWRCRLHGFRLVGLRAGGFYHRLGKSTVNVLGFKAHIDSPVRGYYQFRNVTAMMRRGYVPLRWKLSQSVRSAIKLGVLALLAGDGCMRVGLALRGIGDGIIGRLGPCRYPVVTE